MRHKVINLTDPTLFCAWVAEIQSLTLRISKAWFPKRTMKDEIERLAFLIRNGSQYLEHAGSKLPDKELTDAILRKAELLMQKRKLI